MRSGKPQISDMCARHKSQISRNRFLSFSRVKLQKKFSCVSWWMHVRRIKRDIFFYYNITFSCCFLCCCTKFFQAPKKVQQHWSAARRKTSSCVSYDDNFKACAHSGARCLQETHYLIEAILIVVLAFHFATNGNEVEE